MNYIDTDTATIDLRLLDFPHWLLSDAKKEAAIKLLSDDQFIGRQRGRWRHPGGLLQLHPQR